MVPGQLRSVSDGIPVDDDCWIAGLPDDGAAPTPARGVDPATHQSVVDAIRQSDAIKVEQFQSLCNPGPRWRWIAPHAIAFDGLRWHARAFCVTDEVFKDFLLSRLLDIPRSRESDSLANKDDDRNTLAAREIGPHPALSDTQAKLNALNCGMTGGWAEIGIRRALPYHALRRLAGAGQRYGKGFALRGHPCYRRAERAGVARATVA